MTQITRRCASNFAAIVHSNNYWYSAHGKWTALITKTHTYRGTRANVKPKHMGETIELLTAIQTIPLVLVQQTDGRQPRNLDDRKGALHGTQRIRTGDFVGTFQDLEFHVGHHALQTATERERGVNAIPLGCDNMYIMFNKTGLTYRNTCVRGVWWL